MSIRLRFHGAARTVTGSCYLLEAGSQQLLIDCGMFQGSKTEKELNYRPFPFDPEGVSAVLLTRSNYNVMIKYVDSRTNLILIMDLLRDTSPHITLDAWQVFKVFVANPNKPNDVIKILRDNKVKLCRYLESLHRDREESDAQFRDEKALIIATIEAL